MKLTLKQPHLSIAQFEPVEIADFSVLTGVNGSGKSHLLDAIHQRKILIDGQTSLSVVKFNFETFKLENEGAYNAHQLTDERESAWTNFSTQLLPMLRAQRSKIKTPISGDSLPFWDLAGDGYRSAVKGAFTQKPLSKQPGLLQLIQTLPYPPDEVTKEEFVLLYKPYTHVHDFLPNALGKVVWDYYVKYRDNQLNEYENEKHGKNYPFKTEVEFVAAHGEKPWELINRILEKFDTLDYAVNSPEGTSIHNNFTLKLLHTKIPDLHIDFSSLSSGERVLMALVASIYKASSDKHFPDVLLLDELDASLHPSMIRNMLAVIKDIFLARGIKVILVTHSPSTIALVPDESVYVMRKYGTKRIWKSPKKEALSILTEGFATLDEGLVFLDEVAKHPVSILTEGHNVLLIRKALELFEIQGVAVVEGLEAISGKEQLKTLYDFLSRIPHRNKVLFVWDCDASKYLNLPETHNTYRFFIPSNDKNAFIKSGIENAFPEILFDGFKKTITLSNGKESKLFDETRKKDFSRFVAGRSQLADFSHFSTLREKIASLAADASAAVSLPEKASRTIPMDNQRKNLGDAAND